MTIEVFSGEMARLLTVAYDALADAEVESDRRIVLARIKTAENAILEVRDMVERFSR